MNGKKKKWFNPKEKLPEQRKKVLCIENGDIFVLQRFKNFWFSLPFSDSQYSRFHPPKLWSEIDFPEPLKGKMYVLFNKKLIDMDEYEKEDPKGFDELVRVL